MGNKKKNKQNTVLEAALTGKEATTEEATTEEAEQVAAQESSEEAAKEAAEADQSKKRYKVLVSSLGGKGNKIFEHNEEVTADQLNGNVEALIEGGFIK